MASSCTNRISTEDYLNSIDPDLAKYSIVLEEKGFTSTRNLAFLQSTDIQELPPGHARQLLNHTSLLLKPSTEMHTDTSGITSNTSICTNDDLPFISDIDDLGIDEICRVFKIETPMQKELNCLKSKLLDKREKIRDKQEIIDEVLAIEKQSLVASFQNLGGRCSLCHLSSGHKRRKCTSNPCLSYKQCLNLKLHKDEMKKFQNEKGIMKKLLKEKQVIEDEIKRVEEVVRSTTRSFTSIVKPYLLKSQPKSYLVKVGKEWLPQSRKINLHLSILSNHYGNIIPQDLDSEYHLFQSVLDEHFNIHPISGAHTFSPGQKLNSILCQKPLNNLDQSTTSPVLTDQSPRNRFVRQESQSDTVDIDKSTTNTCNNNSQQEHVSATSCKTKSLDKGRKKSKFNTVVNQMQSLLSPRKKRYRSSENRDNLSVSSDGMSMSTPTIWHDVTEPLQVADNPSNKRHNLYCDREESSVNFKSYSHTDVSQSGSIGRGEFNFRTSPSNCFYDSELYNCSTNLNQTRSHSQLDSSNWHSPEVSNVQSQTFSVQRLPMYEHDKKKADSTNYMNPSYMDMYSQFNLNPVGQPNVQTYGSQDCALDLTCRPTVKQSETLSKEVHKGNPENQKLEKPGTEKNEGNVQKCLFKPYI